MRFGPFLTVMPLALVACVSAPAPRAPVAPPPKPVVRPAPPPVVAPVPNLAWVDRPLTPGTWTYAEDARGGLALYGVPGANAALVIRCDRAAARVYVSKPGTVGGTMVLRATTGAQSYRALPTAGTPPYVAAEFAPRDPQLDAITFSRGRFMVTLDGTTDAIVPTWPEVSRVIEDCR